MKFTIDQDEDHRCQQNAGVIDDREQQVRVVASVDIRPQNLGADESSDNPPLGRGKIAFEKVVFEVIAEQIQAKAPPGEGADIRKDHDEEGQHTEVKGKVRLQVKHDPVKAESVQAGDGDEDEIGRQNRLVR
jgi:hypothetical protein